MSSSSSAGMSIRGGKEEGGGISSGITVFSVLEGFCSFLCGFGFRLDFLTLACGGDFSTFGVTSFGTWGFQSALLKNKVERNVTKRIKTEKIMAGPFNQWKKLSIGP